MEKREKLRYFLWTFIGILAIIGLASSYGKLIDPDSVLSYLDIDALGFLNKSGTNANQNVDLYDGTTRYNFTTDTGYFEGIGINMNPGEIPEVALDVRGISDFNGYYLYNVSQIISGVGVMQSLMLKSTGTMGFVLDPYDRNSDQHFRWYVDGEAEANRIMWLHESGNLETIGNVTADWFKGKFNWTSADDYNLFDGSILDFNESKMNDTIDARGGDNATWNQSKANSLYAPNTTLGIQVLSNLTEDNVEAYIFDNDNTDNLNMSHYNITGIDCFFFKSEGSWCSV